MHIRPAAATDLNSLASLFDEYRRFYRMQSNMEGARTFLAARMERGESAILMAFDEGLAVGFTQLYPAFSSAAMAPLFILNDLFVAPAARRRGTGSALLRAAADYGRRAGAVRLTLSTELTNTAAQGLYERLGWQRDVVFCSYLLAL